MISKTLIVAVGALLIAYFYGRHIKHDEISDASSEAEELVAAAWEERIIVPVKRFKKVAVGLNANVDLIVRGTELLQSLGVTPGEKKDHRTVGSIADMQEAFTHYFSKGAAAERPFTDGPLYKNTVVKAAATLKSSEWFIGGNAALISQKITSIFPDTQVQLVGPVGPKLKELLNKTIYVPKASSHEQDEVHLIMEYKRGEKWGAFTAPVANRFITSYDIANGQATMMDTFFASFDEFKPDLVVLSGLNQLEGQGEEFWSKKVFTLGVALKKLPDSIPVHLELASMAEERFLKQILDEVLPSVSSVGFNEQELGFVSHTGGGPHPEIWLRQPQSQQDKDDDDEQLVPSVSSLGLNEQEISFASKVGDGPHKEYFDEHESGKQPEIHKISDMVLWILQTYGYSKSRPESKLTRVHFHSLTYHIVGVVPNAWGNTASAVAAGTRAAGQQACDTEDLDSVNADLRIPLEFKLTSSSDEKSFDPSEPSSVWKREGYKFAFSPVLVCKNPLKTVGLGDAISATGLLYSEYNADFRSKS
ncbi:ADP-dependent glucokinase isoform X1 [Lingula anatina]|uniref:ADP-dependent glucokinase isoform X1 n=1 Tax=Lingula anatina TaxID=7574 RepID=A0A1S3HI65_LINAN|nr:ADP-dependent glucokinase isoform X1 [Lingula anatina]|eukprot:XP_013385712.1 ADP-dependent glucokinase isoform X1 [Lingula anatina]